VRSAKHRAQLRDDLKYFLIGIAELAGNPCDVAAWSREARHEARANRVARSEHDDRDRLGLLAEGLYRSRVDGENNGRFERNQLGREFPIAFSAAASGPVVKNDIAALDPAALFQFFDEYLPALSNLRVGQRKLSEDRNTSYRCLCRSRQRKSDKARANKPY
jgi:hypothetical protein